MLHLPEFPRDASALGSWGQVVRTSLALARAFCIQKGQDVGQRYPADLALERKGAALPEEGKTVLARGHKVGPSPPVTFTGAGEAGPGDEGPPTFRALVLSQAQPCLGKVMSQVEPADVSGLCEHPGCRVGKGISTQRLLISSPLPLMPDATVPATPAQNP